MQEMSPPYGIKPMRGPADKTNRLYKAEAIHRLLESIGCTPTSEAEANCFRQLASQTAMVAA
jgi:hypothetical protein